MPEENADNKIPYETIAHTADLALRVRGGDLCDLFVNAARALFAVMTEPLEESTTERMVDVDAVDTEALLVDWLNELICLHETEGETYTRFVLEDFSPTHLTARVFGGPTREKTLVVKAATFHDLAIVPQDGGVTATIVFDI